MRNKSGNLSSKVPKSRRAIALKNLRRSNPRTAPAGNGYAQKAYQDLVVALGRPPTQRELRECTGCRRTTAWRVLKWGSNYPRRVPPT
jgi:hypothetical protein